MAWSVILAWEGEICAFCSVPLLWTEVMWGNFGSSGAGCDLGRTVTATAAVEHLEEKFLMSDTGRSCSAFPQELA